MFEKNLPRLEDARPWAALSCTSWAISSWCWWYWRALSRSWRSQDKSMLGCHIVNSTECDVVIYLTPLHRPACIGQHVPDQHTPSSRLLCRPARGPTPGLVYGTIWPCQSPAESGRHCRGCCTLVLLHVGSPNSAKDIISLLTPWPFHRLSPLLKDKVLLTFLFFNTENIFFLNV